MAVNYNDILRQVAIRIGDAGSIVGSDTATVETNFNTANFGAAQIDNPAFPFSAMVHALLLAEEKIAVVIANQKNHPLRTFLRGVSDQVVNRGQLPTATFLGDPVIGVIGPVKDYTDSAIYSQVDTIAEVERLNRLRANVLKAKVRKFAVEGATIVHTAANSVIIELCKYNKTTQKALVLANGPMIFPDAMEETLVCGTLSFLFRHDEAPDTVKHYLEFFADSLRRLEAGSLPQQS